MPEAEVTRQLAVWDSTCVGKTGESPVEREYQGILDN